MPIDVLITFHKRAYEALGAAQAHLMRVKDEALAERFGEEA
ncbi:MAG: hypothetical protein AAF089_17630 [Bacteroidota bacterium]